MKLTCYQVDPQPAEMVPGAPDREWMDGFADRHPYRCLPLVVANTTGWALLSPVQFTATWTGGPRIEDIRLDPDDDTPRALLDRWAVSHFSGGVLTFHTGWLFRTEPGWDLWAGGPPNHDQGRHPAARGRGRDLLAAVSVHDELAFHAAGHDLVQEGRAVLFYYPLPHASVDQFEPVVKRLAAEPELVAEYEAWRKSREDFLVGLDANDPEVVRQGWQRHYFRGQKPSGAAPVDTHIHRRRLKPPRPAKPGE